MDVVNKASCLVMDDGKILLVKDDDGCWRLPGGSFSGEEPESVAVSCTKEMTGIDARIIQLFGLYEYQVGGVNFSETVFESDVHPDGSREAYAPGCLGVMWVKKEDVGDGPLCHGLKLVLEDL